MNDSQTVHAFQFRPQAAELCVTFSRHTALSLAISARRNRGFSIINYCLYNIIITSSSRNVGKLDDIVSVFRKQTRGLSMSRTDTVETLA